MFLDGRRREPLRPSPSSGGQEHLGRSFVTKREIHGMMNVFHSDRGDMKTRNQDFDELVKTYRPRLYGLARRMIGDDETAEEIVQDAFLIVHRKLQDFRGDSSLYTWMYRITANLCLKAKSKLTRERIRLADAEMESLVISDTDTGQMELSSLRTLPENALLYKELITHIKTECHFYLLGVLTEGQRMVYLLRTQEKLAFKQIGEVLDIGENAAKARMKRAVTLIEEELRTRCSLCNAGGHCSCDDCARYIVYKHPEVLQKIRNDRK